MAKGFTIRGEWKDTSHLQPFSLNVEIDNRSVTLLVTFSHHCFTDEKENGPHLFKNEDRYWSEERYQSSLLLPNIIRDRFIAAYAVAFRSKSGGEQYHYMELYDYAIFFDINKPDIPDTLRVKVVSAYELDKWGKEALPKGKAKKISWILSQRIQGKLTL